MQAAPCARRRDRDDRPAGDAACVEEAGEGIIGTPRGLRLPHPDVGNRVQVSPAPSPLAPIPIKDAPLRAFRGPI